METKALMGIILIVVGVIAIFSILGGFTNVLTDSSEKASNPNNCYESGLWLNSSNNVCIDSNGDYVKDTVYSRLPLSAFFSTTGIILIVLMITIFITIVIWLFKKQ
jgi:flagellar basal body-associated protein FliL